MQAWNHVKGVMLLADFNDLILPYRYGKLALPPFPEPVPPEKIAPALLRDCSPPGPVAPSVPRGIFPARNG